MKSSQSVSHLRNALYQNQTIFLLLKSRSEFEHEILDEFYRSKTNTTIQTERRAILSEFVSFGLQIHSIEISKTSNMPCTPPQNGSKSQ